MYGVPGRYKLIVLRVADITTNEKLLLLLSKGGISFAEKKSDVDVPLIRPH